MTVSRQAWHGAGGQDLLSGMYGAVRKCRDKCLFSEVSSVCGPWPNMEWCCRHVGLY